MPHIIKKQINPYTADQMFDLVADFEKYPNFLPFCTKAVNEKINEHELYGTLYIDKGPFKKSFTTHNKMFRNESPQKMTIQLVKGPFKSLEGQWTFSDLEQGSEIKLELTYSMGSGILNTMMSGVFEMIAKTMVDCFDKESRKIYNSDSSLNKSVLK